MADVDASGIRREWFNRMHPSFGRRQATHTTTVRSQAMKSLLLIVKTLVLSLLLAGTAWAQETVNINTADATEIAQALTNIGPAKAKAIVEFRAINGAFRSVEQLAMVKGIGLATIEKNRDRIVLSTARSPGKVAKR
ncbi:MAG: ComEA family DNA-binding protein [Lysobacter sp.]